MNAMFEFAKLKKKELTLSVILSMTGAMLSVVPYLFIFYVIREFVYKPDSIDLTYITKIILAVSGIILVKYFLVLFSFIFSHIAAFDLLYIIRTRVIEHIGKLHMGFWNSNNSGKIRKIIQEDVERIENFVAHSIPDIVAGIITPVVTISVLFFIDWRLSIFTLIPLIIGVILIWLMFGGYFVEGNRKETFSKYHNSIERMHSTIVEYIKGMPVVKIFGMNVHSFIKLKKAVTDYKDFTVRLSWIQTPFYAVFIAMISAGGLFIIPAGLYYLRLGKLDISTFLLFLILGPGCFVQFVKVISLVGHSEILFEAANRIQSILDESPMQEKKQEDMTYNNTGLFSDFLIIKASKNKKRFNVDNNSIEFRNVNFSYNKGNSLALKNICLSIPKGSFIAVVGPSGAGKTTMIQLIARMWDVEDGEICIGGKNIKEIPVELLNNTIGTVFQEVNILKDTVRANICMNQENADFDKVVNAAKTACIHDVITKLPHGYNTVIGDGGEVQLSGGEKQRISLARVVMKNSPIILLDEASCYADSENEIMIQQAFSNIAVDKTVIVIAHRLSTITGADNIVVVDKGKIVETGNHEKLLQMKGLYSKMWDEHKSAEKWNIKKDTGGINEQ